MSLKHGYFIEPDQDERMLNRWRLTQSLPRYAMPEGCLPAMIPDAWMRDPIEPEQRRVFHTSMREAFSVAQLHFLSTAITISQKYKRISIAANRGDGGAEQRAIDEMDAKRPQESHDKEAEELKWITEDIKKSEVIGLVKVSGEGLRRSLAVFINTDLSPELLASFLQTTPDCPPGYASYAYVLASIVPDWPEPSESQGDGAERREKGESSREEGEEEDQGDAVGNQESKDGKTAAKGDGYGPIKVMLEVADGQDASVLGRSKPKEDDPNIETAVDEVERANKDEDSNRDIHEDSKVLKDSENAEDGARDEDTSEHENESNSEGENGSDNGNGEEEVEDENGDKDRCENANQSEDESEDESENESEQSGNKDPALWDLRDAPEYKPKSPPYWHRRAQGWLSKTQEHRITVDLETLHDVWSDGVVRACLHHRSMYCTHVYVVLDGRFAADGETVLLVAVTDAHYRTRRVDLAVLREEIVVKGLESLTFDLDQLRGDWTGVVRGPVMKEARRMEIVQRKRKARQKRWEERRARRKEAKRVARRGSDSASRGEGDEDVVREGDEDVQRDIGQDDRDGSSDDSEEEEEVDDDEEDEGDEEEESDSDSDSGDEYLNEEEIDWVENKDYLKVKKSERSEASSVTVP